MKSIVKIFTVCAALFTVGAYAAETQTQGQEPMGGTQPHQTQGTQAGGAAQQSNAQFSKLDADKNNSISKQEASKDPGLAKSFSEIDEDHNNQLSAEEFSRYVEVQEPTE